MNIFLQSAGNVISSGGFISGISTIFIVGIVLGFILNHGFGGFKKSAVMILPFFIVAIWMTEIRIIEASQVREITGNAYNGIWTLIFTAIGYFSGLFIGHVAVHAGRRQAIEEFLSKDSDVATTS